jgi:hypothetical protein
VEGRVTLTPAEAKAIAASAYVFLAPLVTNYAAMYHWAIDPSSQTYGGGFGRWVHHRTSVTQETDVSTSHMTWSHSSAWLDLRSEPWVFSMPAMAADDAHVVRMTDLWGFVVDEPSDDDVPDRVLLVSPSWMGEIPTVIHRVARGESDFVRAEIWFRTHDVGGPAPVGNIQREPQLVPLSAHLGVAAPAAAPPLDWWPVHGDVHSTHEFWSVAAYALTLTTPHRQDQAILERIAEIGLVAGRRWDPARFDEPVLAAIEEGIDDAITQLMRASSAFDSDELHRSRADTDRDYLGRALGALRPGPSWLPTGR